MKNIMIVVAHHAAGVPNDFAKVSVPSALISEDYKRELVHLYNSRKSRRGRPTPIEQFTFTGELVAHLDHIRLFVRTPYRTSDADLALIGDARQRLDKVETATDLFYRYVLLVTHEPFAEHKLKPSLLERVLEVPSPDLLALLEPAVDNILHHLVPAYRKLYQFILVEAPKEELRQVQSRLTGQLPRLTRLGQQKGKPLVEVLRLVRNTGDEALLKAVTAQMQMLLDDAVAWVQLRQAVMDEMTRESMGPRSTVMPPWWR